MIESARFAQRAGAAWLILQPPRPPASVPTCSTFFGAVADSVDCPVGIQNAPDFLGIGLTAGRTGRTQSPPPQRYASSRRRHAPCGVGRLIEGLGGRMRVFNGRAGLELTDNYRAGVDGMIPGIETIDLQVAIEQRHAGR